MCLWVLSVDCFGICCFQLDLLWVQNRTQAHLALSLCDFRFLQTRDWQQLFRNNSDKRYRPLTSCCFKDLKIRLAIKTQVSVCILNRLTTIQHTHKFMKLWSHVFVLSTPNCGQYSLLFKLFFFLFCFFCRREINKVQIISKFVTLQRTGGLLDWWLFYFMFNVFKLCNQICPFLMLVVFAGSKSEKTRF